MSLLGSLLGGLGGGGGGQAGIGNKANSNSTTNTSTTQYTDSSTAAGGDGSIAAGSGASINIASLSEGVVKDALGSNTQVTGAALGSNTQIASKAIDAGLQQTVFTVNTLNSFAEKAARENQDVRNSADLALRSSAGLTQQLQETTAAALARAQAPEAESVTRIMKPLIIGAAVIFGLFILVSFGRNRSAK